MVPVWLAIFFISVFALFISIDIPKREAADNQLIADVSATNFTAYRTAVRAYVKDNPSSVNVTISDTDLASHFLPGYKRDIVQWPWTNFVDTSGALYVYSTTASSSNADVFYAIHKRYEKAGSDLFLGTKNPTTGRLMSYRNIDTGVVLPATIPDNAIVIIGK